MTVRPQAEYTGAGMSELRVTPWKRYGHDRLYVSTPDGTNVAWFDRKTGELKLLVEHARDAALDALAPYVTEHAPPRPHQDSGAPAPPRPQDSPENDLALNRPGEALRRMLAAEAPGKWERLCAKLLRFRSEWDSGESGLKGEIRIGRHLDRLASRGDWHVLHSVPLPRDVDIDHLLIGPGGVFCVNTKRHPGKDVWVGDHVAKINNGTPQHYPRKARAEAERVRKTLQPHCDFPLTVHPVLAFTGTSRLRTAPTLKDVHVYEDRGILALRRTPRTLTPTQIATLHNTARNRTTWPTT